MAGRRWVGGGGDGPSEAHRVSYLRLDSERGGAPRTRLLRLEGPVYDGLYQLFSTAVGDMPGPSKVGLRQAARLILLAST